METVVNPSRRRLFRGKIAQEHVLRLPWVVSEAAFLSQCDQCQDCISVCETQIITKDSQGFPKIDFSKDECTFCNKCVDACEKPMFVPEEERQNNSTQPWPARIDISNKCLATNNIFCQSCQDVCETRAIKFHLLTSGVPKPELTLDNCTSCGACVSTCPQDAIKFVDENEQVYA